MKARDAVIFLRKHALHALPSDVAEAIAELIDHTVRIEQALQLIEDATQSAISRRPKFATITDRGGVDLPIGPPAAKEKPPRTYQPKHGTYAGTCGAVPAGVGGGDGGDRCDLPPFHNGLHETEDGLAFRARPGTSARAVRRREAIGLRERGRR